MAKTIKQKCEEIGISLPTYYLRIKNGMTPEEALSIPNRKSGTGRKTASKPQPVPEPKDQEPRAPLMAKCGGGTSCVFESDFQNRQHEFNKNRTRRFAKTASASAPERPEKTKHSNYIEELGDRYRITPKKKAKAPAPVASPVENEETEKIDNYEYVNRKPLRYGPSPNPWNAADEAKFNNACGGYTAVILNHIKDGEFKYQIYSTNTKKKLYTNDLVRFINQIIKICDPEGKTPFRVIER